MKKAHSGFTLLELMVVLVIAGILFAVGVPAMGNFMRNSRITSAANDVMAGLHFARSEAIKQRQPVTLCTSATPLAADPDCAASADLTGWVIFVDLNQSGTHDAAEVVLQRREPIPDTITARTSVNPFRVTYLLNGFADNAGIPTQIALCDERGNVPTGGELSSARGILVGVTGRAGVSRDLAEIQDLIDDIGGPIGGCTS